MGYTFPKGLKIVTEQGENARFAADFLKDEIFFRSGAVIPVENAAQADREAEAGEGEILLQTDSELEEETFTLTRKGDGIKIQAADKRGFLYGVSWVLRKMYLKDRKTGFSEELTDIKIQPSYRMRGHQLGYRDKQNTCPAWTEIEYERYIRDLLIFGSNSIELLPPRTDDNLFSGHFKRDPFELMIELSGIIHSYGMDVHVWYPYLSLSIEGDTFKKEMAEREKIFKAVPYIDGLLIPAGDPGDLPPKEMFQAAKATADVLHRYHPNAKVWLAPQAFSPEEHWYEDFYEEVSKEPDWLYGVCFAPWEKDPIQDMYAQLPERYQKTIRNYPDITHNVSSQFEVPGWDEAFAYTLGRESYNARPCAFRQIHDYHKGYVMGSITYSEGIHDDVNKMVWGNLDYREEAPVEEAVRDYVRFFIDPDLTDELSGLIFKLEESWTGRILENANIDALYEKMMSIDKRVSRETGKNFRYQMLLLRILGDYQTKLRYAHDQQLEKEAYEALQAKESVDERIEKALNTLRKTWLEPVGVKERFQMQRLADELYRSCKIQLTTTRHKGQYLDRGAWLDTLNMALNDFQYLHQMLNRAKALTTEEEKAQAVEEVVNRCNPGEGGQYFRMGSFEGFSHVKPTLTFAEDPCFVRSPLMAHSTYLIMKTYQSIGWYDEVPFPLAWTHGARSLYGTPLVAEFDGLDPEADYELSVTYQNMLLFDDHFNLKLWAGGELIHTELERKYKNGADPDPTYTWALPKSSYQDGKLKLTWQTYQPEGGCTISEIWIRKKN